MTLPVTLEDVERMFIMDAIENFLAEPEHSQSVREVVQGLRTKIEGPPGDSIQLLYASIRELRARGISIGEALGLAEHEYFQMEPVEPMEPQPVPCTHPEHRLSVGPARDTKTGRMLRSNEAKCLTCGDTVRRKRQ